MKNKLIYLSFFAMLAIGVIANTSSAQIAGGYGDADVADKTVKTAANVAVKRLAKIDGHPVTLISIVKAEQQVVAGMNYRLVMKVRELKRTRTYTVVVFRSLKGKYSLSKWKRGEHADL